MAIDISTWEIGNEATAPGAGTVLVAKTLKSGYRGHIYGFLLSAEEANQFRINWTSQGVARSKKIDFSGAGTISEEMKEHLNKGLEADAGTTITITNITAAVAGKIYQASLFFMEVR